ncbi:MAG: metallophosphoesterase [Bacteroidales bacterium]
MLLFLWHILTSIISFLLVREISTGLKPLNRKGLLIGNLLVTIIISLFYIFSASHGSEQDTPGGITAQMNLNLVIAAFVFPRTLLIVLHHTGKLIRRRKTVPANAFSTAGIVLYVLILTVIMHGHFIGRFRFTLEEVEIPVAGLHKDLDGLRIVHISDFHLGSFHNNHGKLMRMARMINDLEPDLILDTGDFITLGYREFGNTDTILVKMTAKYGKYAVLGNHDIGTYLTEKDAHIIEMTIQNVSRLVRRSGYSLLENTTEIVSIGEATLALTGAETRGRHPMIVHPDITGAVQELEDADLRILLTHDPNHWNEILKEYPDIEITLAGHTHAMQFGIRAGGLKWSPSVYSYPRWNGLYKEGDMYLYVNRGAGVLGIPVRIGMPPEITRIILKRE